MPQQTRLVCVARVRFAGLYPRKNGFTVGFALRRRLKSPWIVKTTDYGPRWRGHFVDVKSGDHLDNELRTWLQEAHDTVGLQDDLDRAARNKRGTPAARASSREGSKARPRRG